MTTPRDMADTLSPDTLNARLLAAHAAGDRHAMVDLYELAALQCNAEDAAAFFRTQAYIFALETGAPQAAALHAALKATGREA